MPMNSFSFTISSSRLGSRRRKLKIVFKKIWMKYKIWSWWAGWKLTGECTPRTSLKSFRKKQARIRAWSNSMWSRVKEVPLCYSDSIKWLLFWDKKFYFHINYGEIPANRRRELSLLPLPMVPSMVFGSWFSQGSFWTCPCEKRKPAQASLTQEFTKWRRGKRFGRKFLGKFKLWNLRMIFMYWLICCTLLV